LDAGDLGDELGCGQGSNAGQLQQAGLLCDGQQA
jgi:hypothetical protein